MIDQVDALHEVARQVRTAFDGVPRPAAAAIALHQCEECAELRAAFAPFDWQELPPAVIEEHWGSIPLFSPQGLVHYLPAYLLYGLEHFSHDELPTEMLIYALTPKQDVEDQEELLDHHRGKWKYFTEEQMQAVSAFLLLVEGDEAFRVYLGDVGPGRRRLLRIWEQRWAS